MLRIRLREGNQVPVLGLGTWDLRGEECRGAVEVALEVGYRHIDTADVYGNHEVIGEVIKASGVDRSEIFITTKVWTSDLRKQDALDAGRRFLEELETDYLDLLLVHWPRKGVPINETLEAFAQLKSEGVTRSIGVSNFTIGDLEEVLGTGIEFSVNQIEYHPSYQRQDLRRLCDENKIVVTAYAPLAKGQDLELAEVVELAKKYRKTPAQVVLNWEIVKGMVVIPKSKEKSHLKENFGCLDWKLEEKDIETIDGLDSGNRLYFS